MIENVNLSGVTVSGLTEYVDVNRDELLVKSVLGCRSLDFMEIMPNVKHKANLNYLDSAVVLADGSSCGFNADGSDVFTERTIEVKPVKVNKAWCDKDMKDKFMNHQLQFQAGRETLPFEQKMANANVDAIKKAVEDLIWQGNSGLTIDGLIDLASDTGETTVKVALNSGMTMTQKVDAVVEKIPQRALAKGVNLFMSYTDYAKYVKGLNGAIFATTGRNLYDAADEDMKYNGDSRITIRPVAGLENTNVIYAAPYDAQVYGTDIEGSEAVYKLWFSDDSDMFKFKVLFNAGLALKYPDEIVIGA